MEYVYLLSITIAGATFYRIVYAIDYDAAAVKALIEFPNAEIRNATIE